MVDKSNIRFTKEQLHHYDNRKPDHYRKLALKFSKYNSLLDIGCGPGVFMLAVKKFTNMSKIVGLEREPFYLDICKKRKLHIYEHDLNFPFSFIPDDSFESTICNYSLEYMTKSAIKTTLQEAFRVLCDKGVLFINTRVDGKNLVSGVTSITRNFIYPILESIGFSEILIRRFGPNKRGLNILAKASKIVENSYMEISGGASCKRDFVFLTSSEKTTIKNEDTYTGYYTGFNDGTPSIFRAKSKDKLIWETYPKTPVVCDSSVGSVLYYKHKYFMFFSPKRGGRYKTVSLAASLDGISWKILNKNVINNKDFSENIIEIALPDVIKTSSGRWIMHCEGWVAGKGWRIMRASSSSIEGKWEADLNNVKILGKFVKQYKHFANPKCIEIFPGKFILGFNAAKVCKRFSIGFAESADCTMWQCRKCFPLIKNKKDEMRVESAYITKESLYKDFVEIYCFSCNTIEPKKSAKLKRIVYKGKL